MEYEKKYKKALKVMEGLYNVVRYQSSTDALLTSQTIEKAFSELKESEDEKIRRELIERFKWELKGAEEQDSAGCSRQKDIAMFKRGLAWLEKQGECDIDCLQKHQDSSRPNGGIVLEDFNIGEGFYRLHLDYLNGKQVEEIEELVRMWNTGLNSSNSEQKPSWSEDDEKILSDIYNCIKNLPIFYETIKVNGEDILTQQFVDSIRKWLKSIKDRVQPQPKQEWSEEDGSHINYITRLLEDKKKEYTESGKKNIEKEIDWLKSIKPNHWKPSEDQMEALAIAVHDAHGRSYYEKLFSIYNCLKSL